MITFSDNESFNEMVRLQTDSGDFNAGAREIDRYLRAQGYKETAVVHTLAPSATDPVGISDNNTTSVEDCGRLLGSYLPGENVSAKKHPDKCCLFFWHRIKEPRYRQGFPRIYRWRTKPEKMICASMILPLYTGREQIIFCV